MVHEVVPCSPKICDWVLNLSRDHFGLYQGKKGRVAMGFEVPNRLVFHACIIHCHGPVGFVLRKAKEIIPLQKSWDHGNETPLIWTYIYIYYQTLLKLEERREEERGGDKTWKIIQRFAFWAYIKENQHIHFLMHGHSSRSAFSVHLVRGPKVFSFAFLINLTTKLRSRSVTMEKGHLSWDNIVVHDCKQPLRTIFPFDTTDR